MFFRGTVFFFLFVLTIWATIWALDFSENHRIKFYPPDDTVTYLTEQHETLEARALELTHPRTGERMRFETELPAYFTEFLSKLGAEER